jgi:hypothetical protein
VVAVLLDDHDFPPSLVLGVGRRAVDLSGAMAYVMEEIDWRNSQLSWGPQSAILQLRAFCGVQRIQSVIQCGACT